MTPGETELAGAISAKTTGLMRSWEYWSMRVAKAGGTAAHGQEKGHRAAKPRRGAQDAAALDWAFPVGRRSVLNAGTTTATHNDKIDKGGTR